MQNTARWGGLFWDSTFVVLHRNVSRIKLAIKPANFNSLTYDVIAKRHYLKYVSTYLEVRAIGWYIVVALRLQRPRGWVAVGTNLRQNRRGLLKGVESGFHFKVAMVLKFQLVSGWASWALAHPEYGVSVKPFPTMEADYASLEVGFWMGLKFKLKFGYRVSIPTRRFSHPIFLSISHCELSRIFVLFPFHSFPVLETHD